MTREELDKKIEEARKRSEVLSQAEIDDNSGVRITTNPDKLEEKNEIDFYNTKVIFGGRITPDDYKFEEGCILELWEYNCKPIKIEKAGKTIGLGEIVVVGEHFGVKVTQVF